MEKKLTETQIEAVSDIKNILRDIILSNDGNTIDKTIEIFREVVNQTYGDLNLIIENVNLLGDNKIHIFISLNHVRFNFELDLEIPQDEKRILNLILQCEPWRKTNSKLVESDKRLKKWANSFGGYKSPYGFFM